MSEEGKRGTAATIGLWVLTVLVVLAMGAAGFGKFLQPDMWNDRFVNSWGLPPWLVPVTGVLESLGAALLLVPRVASYGAVLVAAAMLGATGTLLANGMGTETAPPAILLLLALAVGIARRPDAIGPLGVSKNAATSENVDE